MGEYQRSGVMSALRGRQVWLLPPHPFTGQLCAEHFLPETADTILTDTPWHQAGSMHNLHADCRLVLCGHPGNRRCDLPQDYEGPAQSDHLFSLTEDF